MNIDFFNTDCKEAVQNNLVFGICDNQDGTKAYTDIENEDAWVTKVENKNRINTFFTPIDNCMVVLKAGTNDEESTCDGMLTFKNNINLIELKVQRSGGWIQKAMKQLENTINLLEIHNSFENFKLKKAYACNKKHPSFVVMDPEKKKRFFDKTGFRVHIGTIIKI